MSNMRTDKLAEIAAALPLSESVSISEMTDHLISQISEAFVYASKRAANLNGDEGEDELDAQTALDVEGLAKDLANSVMETLVQEKDYDRLVKDVSTVVRFDESVLNLIEIAMLLRNYNIFDIVVDGTLVTSQLPLQACLDLTCTFSMQVRKSEDEGSLAVGVLITARCVRIKSGFSVDSWARTLKKVLPPDLHRLYLGARVQLRTFTRCTSYGVSLTPDDGTEDTKLAALGSSISSQLEGYECTEPETYTAEEEEA